MFIIPVSQLSVQYGGKTMCSKPVRSKWQSGNVIRGVGWFTGKEAQTI